jgi:hypothetical protein
MKSLLRKVSHDLIGTGFLIWFPASVDCVTWLDEERERLPG